MNDASNRVVVVGSGASGLVAALAAKEAGMDPVVVESMSVVGGSSAMSGGGMWIPNNPLMRRAGILDSYERARLYMDTVIGDVGPASSPVRRETFLKQGPVMVEWLASLGFRFFYRPGYPDYYPELPGGCKEGRSIEPALFDLNRLAQPWRKRLNIPLPIPMHTVDAAQICVAFRAAPAFFRAAEVFGLRLIGGRLLGKRLVGLGGSLIAQLLSLLLARGVPVWTDTPMVELMHEQQRVTGVIIEKEGRRIELAARAVILTSGGFAHNEAMRQRYQPHPITTRWTVASPGDKGVAIEAAMALGAATALMDDAWWGAAFVDHNGKANFMLWERSLPYGIIVDQSGQRFVNESTSYVDFVHRQYERHREVPAIPAFFIGDARHRAYYPFGTIPPRFTPRAALESGFIIRANTITDLARACGIDPGRLEATVNRFNDFARAGKDLDFHRGDSAYDRFYSDPTVKPNPNLGPIERPPFFAVRVWPGDLGTKGGLLTDECARVLRENGRPIEGLYAAGNTSASVMGRTYPGPGSTLGPGMVFGMIAGRHAARLAER
ncbi:FAD-binding protein [Chloroflexus sp.]|uniref:FAD-binding protein n=1 Tax=Chloroflexus sp. TaxID=1904827 RepID=UPI002627B785|nr:FAD-binding protein [uncultured Chloroflexus sp.]